MANKDAGPKMGNAPKYRKNQNKNTNAPSSEQTQQLDSAFFETIEQRLANIEQHFSEIKDSYKVFGERIDSLKPQNPLGNSIINSINTKIEGIDSLTKRIDSAIRYMSNDDTVQHIYNGVQTIGKILQKSDEQAKKSTEQSNIYAKKFVKNQNDNHDAIIDEFGTVNDTLKKITANTDVIQSLRTTVEEIGTALADKDVKIKREFPTVNHDEETISELAECGAKILEQLSIAARWYARVKPQLDDNDRYFSEMQEANKKAVEQARESGVAEGRKQIVEEILKRYDDVYKIFKDDAGDDLKILAAILKNAGVEALHVPGDKIEVTDENIVNFESEGIFVKEVGTYIIISPAYKLDSRVVKNATFITDKEFEALRQTENSTVEEVENKAQENQTADENNSVEESVSDTQENQTADENISVEEVASDAQKNQTADENFSQNTSVTESVINIPDSPPESENISVDDSAKVEGKENGGQ